MRIENFIAAKKLIFIRTIAVMDHQSPIKDVSIMRCNFFMRNVNRGLANTFADPIFNMLKMAICFGMLNKVIRMVNGVTIHSKKQWKDLIWKKAWSLEDEDWAYRLSFKKFTARIENTMGGDNYLVW